MAGLIVLPLADWASCDYATNLAGNFVNDKDCQRRRVLKTEQKSQLRAKKRAKGETESLCPIHGTKMICPKCIAAKGGKARAKKHSSKQISTWGKEGGRGRRKRNTA